MGAKFAGSECGYGEVGVARCLRAVVFAPAVCTCAMFRANVDAAQDEADAPLLDRCQDYVVVSVALL